MTVAKQYNNGNGQWETIIVGGPGPTPVGTKLSALTAIAGGTLTATDLVEVVDVSDTTMAASGTNKKTTISDLATAIEAIFTVPANTLRGNNTGSTASPLDLTVAQAITLLSAVQTTRSIGVTAPITGGGTLAADRTIAVSQGTSGAVGVLQLATPAEVLTGTDTAKAITAAGAFSTFAAKSVVINAQVGTTYTLVLADAGKLVTLNNASAITLTVPQNSSVAFPIGTTIDLAQIGAGKVAVAISGSSVVNATPSLGFRAQYSTGTLIKYLTDTWLLVGDLA